MNQNTLLLVLGLIPLGIFAGLSDMFIYDSGRKKIAKALCLLLESYKQEKGTYPHSLEDLAIPLLWKKEPRFYTYVTDGHTYTVSVKLYLSRKYELKSSLEN